MRSIAIVAVMLLGGMAACPRAEANTPASGAPAASAASPAEPAAPATPPEAAPAPGAESAEPAQAAAADPPRPLPPSLIARVNLTTQQMTVHANGKLIHAWKISSGRDGYDTPVGTFKPDWMAKLWLSRQYDDAPMPHAVFFKDGAAIHATTAVGALGSPASHGCVRLAPANAETFYKLVARHGLAMTRIAVSGKAPSRPEPAVARRERPGVAYAYRAPSGSVYRPAAYGYPAYAVAPSAHYYSPYRSVVVPSRVYGGRY